METEAIKTGHNEEMRLEHVYSLCICIFFSPWTQSDMLVKYNKLTSLKSDSVSIYSSLNCIYPLLNYYVFNQQQVFSPRSI
jgi:hypothetical protein